MLTSGQCQIVAYLTDGDIICKSCGDYIINSTGFDWGEVYTAKAAEMFASVNEDDLAYWQDHDVRDAVQEHYEKLLEENGLRPVIAYELESDETWSEEGCYCGDCGGTIQEPSEEYLESLNEDDYEGDEYDTEEEDV